MIELLVVIAIIAILLSVLLPAVSVVREKARQRSCAARIRQHTIAMNMYADQNDSRLPLPNTIGAWLQDVAVNTVHFMLRTGMTREIFYCPSNHNHQRYNDLFWMYNNNSWNGRVFTRESGFIVSGYCYVLEMASAASGGGGTVASGSGGRPEIVRYATDSERKIWLRTTQEKQPASREMVIDSIMGVRATGTKYGRNFGKVQGGIYGQSGVYDQTSHLKSDVEPLGGNVGFLDTHTDWRKFEPEMQNGVARPRYNDSPGFFW